ncbi:MAG: hypothetical protein ACT4OV_11400 [Microthrixaceae bacterium]
MSQQVSAIALADAPTEAFRAAVDADVRDQASPELASELRAEAARPRWLYELRRLRVSLDGQRAAKKADARSRAIELRLAGSNDAAEKVWADHWRWFAGNARFGSALDEKLAEARFLNAVGLTPPCRLRSAIELHQRQLANSDIEPSMFDEDLWASLSS